MKGSTKKKIEGYLFIFPWIIGLSVFVLYPAGYGLVLGFSKFDIFNPPRWDHRAAPVPDLERP